MRNKKSGASKKASLTFPRFLASTFPPPDAYKKPINEKSVEFPVMAT